LLLFLFSESQGFIPIAGYNHGAQNYERVKESIQISIKYAALSLILFFYTLLCNAYCIRFTTDPKVTETPDALRWYLQLPIAIQLIELPIFRRRKC
jgi:Na+-driven multidrug efflux pump